VLTAHAWRFDVNILYVESSRSWGGQEYRTCLEINWLNAHGHQAWLICNPDSQVHSKASELGTRLVTMPLRSRVDPLCSWRLWKFCRKNRIDLLKTYSSKDHWICLPLFLCGIPIEPRALHHRSNRQPKSRICFQARLFANRCRRFGDQTPVGGKTRN
jgi:hypothetical protein